MALYVTMIYAKIRFQLAYGVGSTQTLGKKYKRSLMQVNFTENKLWISLQCILWKWFAAKVLIAWQKLSSVKSTGQGWMGGRGWGWVEGELPFLNSRLLRCPLKNKNMTCNTNTHWKYPLFERQLAKKQILANTKVKIKKLKTFENRRREEEMQIDRQTVVCLCFFFTNCPS